MAIEYLGLSEINGPLVVLEGVKNASFEEIVEFHMDDGTKKIGRIIEIYEDKAVIQVFEGTDSMSLGNTHTRLTGHPMEIGLSPDILGRTFNGIGEPIDGLGDISPEVYLNINGLPSESCNPGVSPKLYQHRHLRHRRTYHSDPRAEAAYLLRKRPAPRQACRPDRTAGIPRRRFRREFRHRLCSHGR